MPHEVIMPALGMAQDSGQIVAWLKRPGDPVKAGEALMEVETDKATMEVEAQADGFLTEVRADAGDSIPVGDVVAVISETADGAGDAPAGQDDTTEADAAPAEDATPDYGTPVEGQQVIMPALGMSQDSGKIVAWLKKPGDQVGAEDVLFEVETDKAVTEVPAGHDGWLAEIRAEAGEDVPVGEVIAVISAGRPEAPSSRSREDAAGAVTAEAGRGREGGAPPAGAGVARPDADAEAVPTARGAGAAAGVAEPGAATRGSPVAAGRILASPKARRLAAERGLDLGRLVAAGHPQPYHVADLEALASLPAPSAGEAPRSDATPAHVSAEAEPGAFADFLRWAEAEGAPLGRARVLASFAAAALREATGAGRLAVAVSAPGTPAVTFADPDHSPLSVDEGGTDAAPDLVLRDLTATRITALSPGTGGGRAVPVLTITGAGGKMRLAFDFDAARLDPDAAIACLEAVAARIEEPLRHLL